MNLFVRFAVAAASAIVGFALVTLFRMSGGAADTLCDSFVSALDSVPHAALEVETDGLIWIWDRESFEGCALTFVTTDSLLAGATVPRFDALEGSDMYDAGWRMTPSIQADGPGSSIFGVERDSVVCIVAFEQPAYIDDDGEFVVSDTLTVSVQCRDR